MPILYRIFVAAWGAAFLIGYGAAVAQGPDDAAPPPPQTDADRVLAIDVLLAPDPEMAAKAVALNAQLRENYPQGFTLGKAQAPHISLVHRYVRQQDLPAVEEAVAKASAAAKPLEWQLTAKGISSGAWGGLAITSLSVERTPELDRFQEAIVKAVEPFAVKGGTAAAFAVNKELPKIDDNIVAYVENFVPNASGKKYNPHVTAGVAHVEFVKVLEAKPFDTFTFKSVSVSIYQLGNFGTAQKQLWQWPTE